MNPNLHRRVTHALVLFSTTAWAGCSCSEQSYAPLVRGTSELDANYGKWLSLDKGPDGSPVIAYYDVTSTALGFAVGRLEADESVTWNHEKVAGYPDGGLDSVDSGKYASMKVAPDGRVWIAYQENGALWVAHRSDATWTSTLVDTGEGDNAGNWASLALDATGSPVIAHQDADAGALRVCRQDGEAWACEVVFQGLPYSGPTSADDPTNTLRPAGAGAFARLHIFGGVEYIAWHDSAQRKLHLSTRTGTTYEDDVIAGETFDDLGQWPSIWTDGSALAIAFEDRLNGQLKIAERSSPGGTFTISVVDQGDYLGADTEVFMRGDDLAVVYFDGRTNDMKLAQRNGDDWTAEVVGGANGAIGFFNEVVSLGSGHYAASYDYTHKRVYWTLLP